MPTGTVARTEASPRVEMMGVVKRFGSLEAVSGVDLTLHAGEVHALLGENGAGKTTLMNILAGLLEPDAGQIRIAGSTVKLRSASRAAKLGIGMVHQHFKLVRRFTVAENLKVGAQASLVSGSAQQALEMAAKFRMEIDPEALVSDLSVGEQQIIEILRALGRGAEILILDEPTAVLTPQESEGLFAALREVADGGKAVIFISHKLRDAIGHADRITVMRGGSVVANLNEGESDERKLARLMIGRDVARVMAGGIRRRDPEAPVQLRCSGLSVLDDRGKEALKAISLEIRAGEIVGIAGVAGNGQRELAEALTGLRPATAGQIETVDQELSDDNPLGFIDAGIGHVPEDRNETGIAPTESIWQNAILKAYRAPPIGRGWRLSRPEARAFAERVCETAGVTVRDVDIRVRQLSGGNTQRLILGRELLCSNKTLIASHPTRGLDIGAAETVRNALVRARQDGAGILLISGDIDEILNVSDRILVLYEGRIVGEFSAEEADRSQIGLCMAGGATADGLRRKLKSAAQIEAAAQSPGQP